jgi:peptidoglycan hydrolase-like protein with peptidoglycan-binding domain
VAVGQDVTGSRETRLAHLALHASGLDPGPPAEPGFAPDVLRQYQQEHGLAATGEVDEATETVLEQAVVDAFTRWLAPGDEGRDVEALQRALALRDHDGGPPDGIFGRATARAVEQYQRANALQVDRIVGPETWGTLTNLAAGRFHRILRSGARGHDVSWVQAVLVSLGFDSGGADGIFGPNTARAVAEFQSASGLDADSVVGPVTWQALEYRAARPVAAKFRQTQWAVGFGNGRAFAALVEADKPFPVIVTLDDLQVGQPMLPATTARVSAITRPHGPGGPCVVTAWEDGTVRFTDIVDGGDRATFDIPSHRVEHVAAAIRDGEAAVCVTGSGNVAIKGGGRWTFLASSRAEPAAEIPDGAREPVVLSLERGFALAWIDDGRRVVRQDLATADPIGEPLRGADTSFDALLVGGSPERPVLVTRSGAGLVERWWADSGTKLTGVISPDAGDARLLAVGARTLATGNAERTIRRFHLEDGREIEPPIVVPSSSRLSSVALADDGGRTAVAALDADGVLWAWTGSESTADPPDQQIGRTRLQHDQRAEVDRLGRQNLADEVADLVQGLAADRDNPGAFALHLDGPWGAGKSTLVGFVSKCLEEPKAPEPDEPARPAWVVVEVDTWRSSQLSPAWWALLTHLRQGVRKSLPFWQRRSFDLRRIGREARRLWKVWLPPLLALVALGVIWLARADVGAVMAVITTIVAFLALIGGLGSRFLSLGSVQGARLHERLNDNPMGEVAAQILWLRWQSPKPIFLVLDDLDRCNETFAVEVLDAMQTLLRAPVNPERKQTLLHCWWRRLWFREPPEREPKRLPALVVLAVGDHRWLRAAYEHAYAVFSPYVSEPGRPLGHLFLDKLFQVRVELPHLGLEQMATYLSFLLGAELQPKSDGDGPGVEAEIQLAQERSDTGATSLDDAGIAIVSSPGPATAQQRQERASAFLEARRTDTRRELRERHLLEQYGDLLEPNPRAAKRFVMAYNLAFATRLSELAPFKAETLALWTVLATRWPALADWVRDQLPDGPFAPVGEPDHPSRLLLDPEVQRVIDSGKGGPLTIELVKRCNGFLPELAAEQR